MSSLMKFAGTTFQVLPDSPTLIPKSQTRLPLKNPNPNPNILSPMAKPKFKLKKPKLEEKKPAKKKIGKNPRKKKKKLKRKAESSDESDTDYFSNLDKLHSLLEPYTKPQLVDFIADAALKDHTLFNRIQNTADRDPAHRKIFVHGFSWDTTSEALVSLFQSAGEIEDCVLITDRLTGKAKGYAFVVFKTRKGAAKALREPRRKIGNRVVSCHLASHGPTPGQRQAHDTAGRKIFVRDVPHDTDPEKLLRFFAKFGEIEMGPMGFDVQTGKSRGFALFLYKSQDGAMKALEEPHKVFEGHQLHCQMATGKNKVPPAAQVQPAPSLAAVAAAQNMMFSQNSSLSPAYGGLLANPNAVYMNGQGLIRPNQMGQVSQLGLSPLGFGGYNLGFPSLGGNLSVLGPYGSTPQSMGLQPVYHNSQLGLPDPAGTK